MFLHLQKRLSLQHHDVIIHTSKGEIRKSCVTQARRQLVHRGERCQLKSVYDRKTNVWRFFISGYALTWELQLFTDALEATRTFALSQCCSCGSSLTRTDRVHSIHQVFHRATHSSLQLMRLSTLRCHSLICKKCTHFSIDLRLPVQCRLCIILWSLWLLLSLIYSAS